MQEIDQKMNSKLLIPDNYCYHIYMKHDTRFILEFKMNIKIQDIITHFQSQRQITESLCKPLAIEDYVVQSNDDVSPTKWHLAHTSWFFETFILQPHFSGYTPFNPDFNYLFNSYYQSIGHPYPRIKRGALSRPTVETVFEYRKYIDKHIVELLAETINKEKIIYDLIELGIHHEQQHQELLLMDIKYNFYMHPEFPTYQKLKSENIINKLAPIEFITFKGGLIPIGYPGNLFCFDNELPYHNHYLQPYQIANRLVTNGEYLEFIQAGGYHHPEFWLSEGWELMRKLQWNAPLYWERKNNHWMIFTLSGLRELNLLEPVTHVSYYEADAYARWRNLRLPTEFEWEHCANNYAMNSNGIFLESKYFHPQIKQPSELQFFGDAWEWTASSYCAYPGYKAVAGALGEYNGKFMSNQFVLRGGSCVTPQSHIRTSYRNFYQPDKRWQFSGIRLAANI